jgi:hypothetical protein
MQFPRQDYQDISTKAFQLMQYYQGISTGISLPRHFNQGIISDAFQLSHLTDLPQSTSFNQITIQLMH